jgi:antirestriction protein ArdC
MSNTAYETITNRIISTLETGTIPWRKPWKNSAKNGGGALPYNLTNGRAYRGINVWSLMCSSYASNGWATYKQAQTMGYQVRKGEKSTPVVFWKFPTKQEQLEGRAPWMRLYHVFNFEQLDGVSESLPFEDTRTFDSIESAEKIAAGYMAGPSHPSLAHGGSSAYYAPSRDLVQMPPQAAFITPEEYYSTLFHEFSHSTGVKDRCDRDELKGIQRFGDCDYSKEELTAEFGAAFLCAEAGISNEHLLDNSSAYIAGWVAKLKDDKTMVIQAAQRAQKAADYILQRFATSNESETEE